MRIDIAQELKESEDRRVVWSHADAPEIFDELHLKGDLVAQVLVSPEGPSKWLVSGTLSGVQTLTCSRTLELFDRPFETEIVVEVERLGVAKQELDEDDADVFAYRIPQGQYFVDVFWCDDGVMYATEVSTSGSLYDLSRKEAFDMVMGFCMENNGIAKSSSSSAPRSSSSTGRKSSSSTGGKSSSSTGGKSSSSMDDGSSAGTYLTVVT